MADLDHNREVLVKVRPDIQEGVGTICVLLRDGRLFGPFGSRSVARYWCVANDFDGFSTYDLLAPTDSVEALRG